MNQELDILFAQTVQYPQCKVYCNFFENLCNQDCKNLLLGQRVSYWTAATRVKYWFYLTMTCSYISLSIGSLTIVDLYLLLTNPFASTRTRNKRLFFFVFLSAIFTWNFEDAIFNHKRDIIDALSVVKVHDLYGLGALIYALIALIVMAGIICKLQRPGMSSELKKTIAYHYLASCISFIFL
jgi:hypothetical protein